MHSEFATDQPLNELDENIDGGGEGAEALSPRQYAMLMNSMRDPVAMYTTSLGPPDREHEPRPSPPPLYNPYDPLEGFSGHGYNISPTYGQLGGMGVVTDGRGHAAEGVDEVHPMYAMMGSTYQPRPPTAPRNPHNRH